MPKKTGQADKLPAYEELSSHRLQPNLACPVFLCVLTISSDIDSLSSCILLHFQTSHPSCCTSSYSMPSGNPVCSPCRGCCASSCGSRRRLQVRLRSFKLK